MHTLISVDMHNTNEWDSFAIWARNHIILNTILYYLAPLFSSEKCAFGEQSEYSDKFMFLVNFLYLSSLAGDIPVKYAEFIGKYFPEVYLVNTKFAHKILFKFSSIILYAVIWSRCHLRSSFDTIRGFPLKQYNRQVLSMVNHMCRTSRWFV